MGTDVSTYVLLSHQAALRRQLDVTANNMANSSTVGYKREQALFREQVERVQRAQIEDAKRLSFVLDFGAVHDARPGAFQPTGNPLDVMIEGPGYLSVEDAAGATAYTRAGFVTLLPNGELGTPSGAPLLDENGRHIAVPSEEQASLHIAEDGTVSTTSGAIARLAVTQFDELRVSERGDGLLNGAGGRQLGAAETRLHSGGVEGSNVQPIVETTNMIEVLRAYQRTSEAAAGVDALRKMAIARLAKPD
ncbi:flagellar hook-basal body complex protein [Sphingomonas sp. BK235]|uniref:flagellar hook-basal body complex protein n=1 Tax=Sphingomonas sp. BK235 TaxID=2512131 RepID=UPI001052F01C|nr:flagellar hook-basal body complex protein [Sphingomonas sp. BK235]TCP37518.1 flagellar basal-body rod protein FlgF [Sphingomonas sp. BK235]